MKLAFVLRDTFVTHQFSVIPLIFQSLHQAFSKLAQIDKVDLALLSLCCSIAGNLITLTDLHNELLNLSKVLSEHKNYKTLHIDLIYTAMYFTYSSLVKSGPNDNLGQLLDVWQSIHTNVVRQHIYTEGDVDKKKDLEVMFRNIINTFSALVPAAASDGVSIQCIQTCLHYAMHTLSSMYSDGTRSVCMSATLLKYLHFILNAVGRTHNALAGRSTSSAPDYPTQTHTHTSAIDPTNQLCILARAFVSNMQSWIEVDGKVYVDCVETLVSVCVMTHTRPIPYTYTYTSSLLQLSQLCMVLIHKYQQHSKIHSIQIPSSLYSHTSKLTYICSSLCMQCGGDADLETLHAHGVLPNESYAPMAQQFMCAFVHALKKHVLEISEGTGALGFIEAKLSSLVDNTHVASKAYMQTVVSLLAKYFAAVHMGLDVRADNDKGSTPQYIVAIRTLFTVLIDIHTGCVKDMRASILALHDALQQFSRGENIGKCQENCHSQAAMHMLVTAVLSMEWKTVSALLTQNEIQVMNVFSALFSAPDTGDHGVYDYHAVWACNSLLSSMQSYHCPYVYEAMSTSPDQYLASSLLSSKHSKQFHEYIQSCIHAVIASPSTLERSKADFVSMHTECNDLINTLTLPPLLSHTDLYILKIYIALYVSKVMLHVYGDTHLALKQCRYCLSYIHKLHTSSLLPQQQASPITRMLHTEVLACMVDVYDCIGKAHRVMQCMAEMEVVMSQQSVPTVPVVSASPTSFVALPHHNTVWSMYVHLRCVVMYMRLGSSASAQKVQGMMEVYGGVCEGLAGVLRGISMSVHGEDVEFDKKASSLPCAYAVCAEALDYRNIPSPSSVPSSSIRMKSALSFDSLRSSRKDMCIQKMSSSPFASFMHHAASMYTALEMNARHEMGGEDEDKAASKGNEMDCIKNVLGTYSKALEGDKDAVNTLETTLSTLTQNSSLSIVCISIHHRQLLISVYGNGVCEGACVSKGDGLGDGCVQLVKEYESIIAESDSTLVRQEEIQGADLPDEADKKASKGGNKAATKPGSKVKSETKPKGGSVMSEKEKKDWWAKREKTDQALCDNLVKMQSQLGSLLDILNMHTSKSHSGEQDVDKVIQSMESLAVNENSEPGNQTTAAAEGPCVSVYDEMKVTDLRTLSKSRGLSSIGRKQDIIERLLQDDMDKKKDGEKGHNKGSTDNKMDSAQGHGHILFILDELLTSYPIESLPYFRERACSRLPSLLVLLGLIRAQGGMGGKTDLVPASSSSDAKVAKASRIPRAKPAQAPVTVLSPLPPISPLADVSRCWYAVDIENNLPATRDTMMGYMQAYVQRWGWVGVVGSVPEGDVVR